MSKTQNIKAHKMLSANPSTANFNIKVIEEISYNSGGKTSRYYLVIGKTHLGVNLPRLKVKTSEYGSGKWHTEWGRFAIVKDNRLFKEYLLSVLEQTNISSTTKHERTGFSKNIDKYIHTGGVITENGFSKNHRSKLGGKLNNYYLPEPQKDDEEIKNNIVEAQLLFDIAPGNDAIALLIKSSIARALFSEFLPITESYFMIGPTGSRKSALAAVIQSYFGKSFYDQTQLPAEWEATEAALFDIIQKLKNAIVVIDEMTPTPSNEKELGKKMETILRGVANQSARNRANSNGGLRNSSSPNTLVLSTGELLPEQMLNSLYKRIVFFDIEQNDIDLKKLTQAQRLAKNGVLAQFTSNMIRFIIEDREKLKEEIPELHEKYRDRFRRDLPSTLHPRVCEYMSAMYVSISLYNHFLCKHAAIDKEECIALNKSTYTQLLKFAVQQNQILANFKMPNLIFKFIVDALLKKQVHLKSYQNGGMPKKNRSRCGWHKGHPKGNCIGWYNEKNGDIYIKSDHSVFDTLSNLIPDGYRHKVPMSGTKFWQTIKACGGLKSTDHERLTIRKKDPETNQPVTVYYLKLALPSTNR